MNKPLLLDELPELDQADFVGIDNNFRTVVSLPRRGIQLVLSVAAIALAVFVSVWFLVPGLVLVAVVEVALRLRLAGLAYVGYLTREHDVSIRRGLISRTVTTIPYHRIQSSVVNQGPLERRYGLGTLVISPARASVAISGLKLEDANRLRGFVAEQASLQAEDESDGA